VDTPLPERLRDRYEVIGPIGKGGMAVVYLARLVGAAGFSRLVAVKRLTPERADEPTAAEALIDEARVAGQLHHPNVVPVLDALQFDGELFVVMEYVDGLSVGQLLRGLEARRQRVPPHIAATVMCGVLEGLHAAHTVRDEDGELLSIIHRDVSPNNILVGTDGVARLTDFGIAKSDQRMSATLPGQVKGTPGYMSPEQITAQPLTPCSDVYSAGLVLWELLVGEKVTSRAPTPALAPGALPPPSACGAQVGPEVDQVVMRAIANVPAARFESARAFAEALEHACAPLPAREVSAWLQEAAADTLAQRAAYLENVKAGGQSLETPGSTLSSSDGTPPRRRLPVALGAVALAVVVAGVVAWRWPHSPPPLPIAEPEPPHATVEPAPSPPEPPTAPEPSAALEPTPAPRPAPSRVAPTPAEPAHPPRHPSPRKDKKCDPPYAIDAQGIRHLRPECL
jgi:serine/threonine-protein kinase